MRLRHRASLAIWCGCNENLWGYVDWHWQEVLGDRPWGARYYYELLPGARAELDGRAYIPGSPFSPDGEHPNDPNTGTMHIWDVWNQLDYAHYERPRHGSRRSSATRARRPGRRSSRAIGATTLDPDDPALVEHQKAAGRQRSCSAGSTCTSRCRRRPASPGTAAASAGAGPRGRHRHRALPQSRRPVQRRDLLAAQRLLAGDQLVGRRRRRSAQARVVRVARRVPAAHDDRDDGG